MGIHVAITVLLQSFPPQNFNSKNIWRIIFAWNCCLNKSFLLAFPSCSWRWQAGIPRGGSLRCHSRRGSSTNSTKGGKSGRAGCQLLLAAFISSCDKTIIIRELVIREPREPPLFFLFVWSWQACIFQDVMTFTAWLTSLVSWLC